jgi:hypothetical protein
MQPEGSYLRLFEDTMLLKGYVCSFCTVFNLLDANGESLQTPDSMADDAVTYELLSEI